MQNNPSYIKALTIYTRSLLHRVFRLLLVILSVEKANMLFVSRGPKNPRTSRRVQRTFLGGILSGSDAALRRDHYAKISRCRTGVSKCRLMCT